MIVYAEGLLLGGCFRGVPMSGRAMGASRAGSFLEKQRPGQNASTAQRGYRKRRGACGQTNAAADAPSLALGKSLV